MVRMRPGQVASSNYAPLEQETVGGGGFQTTDMKARIRDTSLPRFVEPPRYLECLDLQNLFASSCGVAEYLLHRRAAIEL